MASKTLTACYQLKSLIDLDIIDSQSSREGDAFPPSW